MAFVLDASAAVHLVLDEGLSPVVDAVEAAFVEGDAAQVPPHWLLEVLNALLTAERRGRMPAGSGNRLLPVLLELPIRGAGTPSNPPPDPEVLLDLARAHQLPAYDGAYLQLALDRGLPLATHDKSLARAARELAVPLLGEPTARP